MLAELDPALATRLAEVILLLELPKLLLVLLTELFALEPLLLRLGTLLRGLLFLRALRAARASSFSRISFIILSSLKSISLTSTVPSLSP